MSKTSRKILAKIGAEARRKTESSAGATKHLSPGLAEWTQEMNEGKEAKVALLYKTFAFYNQAIGMAPMLIDTDINTNDLLDIFLDIRRNK